MNRIICIPALILLLAGCNSPLPDSVYGSEGPAIIYPDYKGTTVPVNIAPLNFHYAMESAGKAVTTFTAGGKTVTKRGLEVRWGRKEWKRLL